LDVKIGLISNTMNSFTKALLFNNALPTENSIVLSEKEYGYIINNLDNCTKLVDMDISPTIGESYLLIREIENTYQVITSVVYNGIDFIDINTTNI